MYIIIITVYIQICLCSLYSFGGILLTKDTIFVIFDLCCSSGFHIKVETIVHIGLIDANIVDYVVDDLLYTRTVKGTHSRL